MLHLLALRGRGWKRVVMDAAGMARARKSIRFAFCLIMEAERIEYFMK